MEKMDKVLEEVLEYLKHKRVITELEKDILSTAQICQTKPFNRQAAEKKIVEINVKYTEIYSAVLITPGINPKPLLVMEDGEVWDSLYLQLRALCGKELVVIGEEDGVEVLGNNKKKITISDGKERIF